MICKIRDIFYHDISKQTAAERILKAAKEGKELAVFTPGAVIAAQAQGSLRLLSLLGHGDLILPDGVGCKAAAALCGEGLTHVTPGIDTAELLLSLADPYGMRVFLYGGREGIAERAARRLSHRYPHLVFGMCDGYGADPVDRICAFSPDLVFVCLGFPRQEAWIARHKKRLSAPALGLGGSLDVWSGSVPRAPLSVRRMGCEWLWRVLREPGRLPRLLPLPAYFGGCALVGGRKLLHNFQKAVLKNSETGKM